MENNWNKRLSAKERSLKKALRSKRPPFFVCVLLCALFTFALAAPPPPSLSKKINYIDCPCSISRSSGSVFKKKHTLNDDAGTRLSRSGVIEFGFQICHREFGSELREKFGVPRIDARDQFENSFTGM
jgi:hypothetical protein